MTKVSRPFYFEVGGDPAGYDEVAMREYFKAIMPQDGIFLDILGELLVYEHTAPNDSVNVSTGAVWVQGGWFYSDGIENLVIAAADATKDRYDRIVARLTVASPTSNIDVVVLEGDLYTAGTAVPKELTRNSTTWELSLAKVFVEHGTVPTITNAMITSERFSAYCGVAASKFGPMTVAVDGDLDAGIVKIHNVVDPAADQDADTKAARNAAIYGLIPDQTGKDYKVLQTNGTTTSWETHFVVASASNTLKKSDDAEVTETSATYVLAKRIAIPSNYIPGGVYRIKFDLKNNGVGNIAKLAIMNGTLIGAEQSETSGNYVTKSQDVTIVSGGGVVIELWLKNNTGGTTYAQNLRVYCDETPCAVGW